jgi:predicted transcriptional regulator
LIEHIEQNMTVLPEKVNQLADIVLDPATARDDLAELIEHHWYVIMPPEADKLAQTRQQVAEKTRNILNEIGSLALVEGISRLHLPEKQDSYERVILAPSGFNDKGIVATDNQDETCLIVVYGQDNEVFSTPKNATKDEDTVDPARLATFFNTLSDKTRLEIVRILTDRPHYGQELAKILGISNATVFYHLSMLEKIKVVHLERIEHRVYYALDGERLRQLLTKGSAFLLD